MRGVQPSSSNSRGWGWGRDRRRGRRFHAPYLRGVGSPAARAPTSIVTPSPRSQLAGRIARLRITCSCIAIPMRQEQKELPPDSAPVVLTVASLTWWVCRLCLQITAGEADHCCSQSSADPDRRAARQTDRKVRWPNPRVRPLPSSHRVRSASLALRCSCLHYAMEYYPPAGCA